MKLGTRIGVAFGAFVAAWLLVSLLVGMISSAAADEKVPPIPPDDALKMLQEGNERFSTQAARHPNMDRARLKDTSQNGQTPFATIVGCSDSRVPIELICDQGIGDIFVVRLAGNVCDEAGLGSVEYGVEHLGTPLLLVLGHTQCGAVAAAATGAEAHGHIAALLARIKPAVEKAHKAHPNLEGKALVPEAIKSNVWQTIESLFRESPVVKEKVREGKLKVIGAVYSIETGKVEWLGTHADEKRLIGDKEKKAEPTKAGRAGEHATTVKPLCGLQ